MMQATESPLSPRTLVRGEIDDQATAGVILAVTDLMSAMQRSRMLHHQGAPLRGLLIHLTKFGPMRPSDLAHSMHIDQSTVSRHIARLETDGLVHRSEDPEDRRACVVSATDAGVELAQESIRARIRDFEQLINEWPEQDRAEFARLLTRFVTDFETHLQEGTTA